MLKGGKQLPARRSRSVDGYPARATLADRAGHDAQAEASTTHEHQHECPVDDGQGWLCMHPADTHGERKCQRRQGHALDHGDHCLVAHETDNRAV